MNYFWPIFMMLICSLNAVFAGDAVTSPMQNQTFTEASSYQRGSRESLSTAALPHDLQQQHSDCDHQPHPGCQHQCHLGHCQFLTPSNSSLSIPARAFTVLNPLNELFASSIDLSGPIKPPRA